MAGTRIVLLEWNQRQESQAIRESRDYDSWEADAIDLIASRHFVPCLKGDDKRKIKQE